MINNSIEFFRFSLSINKIAVRTECSYLRKRKRLDILTVHLTRVKHGGRTLLTFAQCCCVDCLRSCQISEQHSFGCSIRPVYSCLILSNFHRNLVISYSMDFYAIKTALKHFWINQTIFNSQPAPNSNNRT